MAAHLGSSAEDPSFPRAAGVSPPPATSTRGPSPAGRALSRRRGWPSASTTFFLAISSPVAAPGRADASGTLQVVPSPRGGGRRGTQDRPPRPPGFTAHNRAAGADSQPRFSTSSSRSQSKGRPGKAGGHRPRDGGTPGPHQTLGPSEGAVRRDTPSCPLHQRDVRPPGVTRLRGSAAGRGPTPRALGRFLGKAGFWAKLWAGPPERLADAQDRRTRSPWDPLPGLPVTPSPCRAPGRTGQHPPPGPLPPPGLVSLTRRLQTRRLWPVRPLPAGRLCLTLPAGPGGSPRKGGQDRGTEARRGSGRALPPAPRREGPVPGGQGERRRVLGHSPRVSGRTQAAPGLRTTSPSAPTEDGRRDAPDALRQTRAGPRAPFSCPSEGRAGSAATGGDALSDAIGAGAGSEHRSSGRGVRGPGRHPGCWQPGHITPLSDPRLLRLQTERKGPGHGPGARPARPPLPRCGTRPTGAGPRRTETRSCSSLRRL